MYEINNEIEISLVLVTYNHEKYVLQALQSIQKQKISVSFELVIADDCSSDTTLNIIRDNVLIKYVRFLKSSSNLGITKNYQRIFNECKGRFIAILEGDDFWIDEDRIETLYKAFLKNPLLSVCFNQAALLYEKENAYKLTAHPVNSTYPITYYTSFDLAKGNFISGFSACMYKKKSIENINPQLFEITSYDWAINLATSISGLIGYIPQPLSVYRIHSSGVWTSKSSIEKIEQLIDLIPKYNAMMANAFSEQFKILDKQLRFELFKHLLKNRHFGLLAHNAISEPLFSLKLAFKMLRKTLRK